VWYADSEALPRGGASYITEIEDYKDRFGYFFGVLIISYLCSKTIINLKVYFMKKIIVVLVMLTSVAANTAFGADDYVTPVARKTFNKEFPMASYVKWDKIDNSDVYQVRFVYNNQSLLSFIHEDGSVLATARNIDRNNLPFMVNETISKKYSEFTIVQIEELSTASEVSYFFTIENEKSRIYLRVFNNGSSSEVKKEKKKFSAELVKK
jgi:hypothetical protein